MLQVTDISNDAIQNFTVNLSDGNRLVLTLRYIPTQNCWYLDIDYKDGEFVLYGTKVVTSYDLLLHWEKIVPIGIAITTEENSEPWFIDDFLTGRCKMFILENKDDFEAIKELRGF